jgi:DNA polymerase
MTLRPTFCAEGADNTLTWGDWSAIEARVLPWLADTPSSHEILDIFRACDADANAPDVYMREAGNIHGVYPDVINERYRNGDREAKGWRNEGKVAVLSLGFGGSVGALLAMAVNYGLHFTEAQALAIVQAWRSNNPWAPDFWSRLTKAFENARKFPGQPFTVGKLTYFGDPNYLGGSVYCILPCGRVLTYSNLKHRSVEKEDPKTGEKYRKMTLTYRKGYTWGSMWHGILAENPTQAAAASILRGTLKRIEKDTEDAGEFALFHTRAHTHDEIIGEHHEEDTDDARDYLKEIMERGFDWTEGLPLAAEVSSNWYYTKAVE